MARKERISRGKRMTPNYFVFCEGDTEIAYVELLRSYYRLPIHIIAKRTLLNITPALVRRCESAYIETKADKTFLMYDLDVPTMLERLRKVPDATLLCSNPCIEVWLLLHYTNQQSEISSHDRNVKLSKYIKHYKKGKLEIPDQVYLMQNISIAIERAKKLREYTNPSSSVYLLIEDLENLKKAKPF